MEAPSKGYFRLFPGNKVRLRYGFVVECTGCDKDDSGQRHRRALQLLADTKSGTPGADAYKVKGNIHWVCGDARLRGRSAALRPPVHARRIPAPGERDFLDDLNPDAKKVITRAARTLAEAGAAGGALPVRAARLLRRRPHRLEARRAGIQSGGDAEGLLGGDQTKATARGGARA